MDITQYRRDKAEDSELDQDMYDICMDKLREVYKITLIMGCESQFTEMAGGVPALAMSIDSKIPDQDSVIIIVTFMPMEIRGEFHLLAEFNTSVIEGVPEDSIANVKEFLSYYNESYMVGTFNLIDDILMGMYTMYTDAESKIDQLLFAKTLSILSVETEDLRELLSPILSGEMTPKELVDEIFNYSRKGKYDEPDDDEPED